MQDLIGDLLDVARIETGTLSVKPAPADVAGMVDDARRRFLGGGGRDNLLVDLAPDLPPVLADQRRIVQVLTNLLSNAAGYSPQGSPIRVSAVRDGVHVAVSVSDEGRGLSAEQLPHLFRKFSRIDGGNAGSSVAGSGPGPRHLQGDSGGPRRPHLGGERRAGPGRAVYLHHAGSRRGRWRRPGSARFNLRWLAQGGEGQAAHLAVDDDPQALRYVRDALTKAGYVPIVTGDPEDVPRLMEEEKPHLVLLDLMLPGSDGIELMNRILKTADVPVIFVSVYGQDDIIVRAFDMGAADYVVKPFSPTELAARIRAALRRRAGPSEPYSLGDLSIDYAGHRVAVAGRPVRLTPTEYELLFELSVHAGRVLTHDQLLQRVWGPERTGEPWLVREVVKRLRRKLGDDANSPRYVITEPRVGYRMAVGEAKAEGPTATL